MTVQPPEGDAWMICPCCEAETDRLHYFSWCDECWYTVCGGDLAPDEMLARTPEAVLSRG